MTQEEFTKLVESLKAQGMEDEDILGTLLDMFKEGKVGADDLEKLAGSMGYEVTEEFKKLAAPEESSEEAPADAEDIKGELSEEEVEEAQEIPESRDDDKDEDEDDSEDEDEGEDDEDSDDSEEKDEARDLFGLKD